MMLVVVLIPLAAFLLTLIGVRIAEVAATGDVGDTSRVFAWVNRHQNDRSSMLSSPPDVPREAGVNPRSVSKPRSWAAVSLATL